MLRLFLKLFICVFFFLFCSNVIAQKGLRAEYFNDIELKNHVLTRMEGKPYLDGYLQSPAPGVNQEYFSVRWSGKLEAPSSGGYKFFVTADDGVRLWIGDKKIIDAWWDQEAASYEGSIWLERGKKYDIRIEYYNSILHCVLKLSWENPEDEYEFFGFTFSDKTDVPSSVFFFEEKQDLDKDKPLVEKEEEKAKSIVTVEAKTEKKQESPPQTKKIQKRALEPKEIAINEPIELKSVHFEQTKYELLPAAFDELDNLIVYLEKHPHLKIKIIGHTDYAGDSTANQVLSEQRAQAVADYFKRRGIDSQRVLVSGMGSVAPRVIHDKAHARKENRRVEFVLLQNDENLGTTSKN